MTMVCEDVGSLRRVYLRWMHRLHCACVGRSPQHDGNRILTNASQSHTKAEHEWTIKDDRTMEQWSSDELENELTQKLQGWLNQILTLVWHHLTNCLALTKIIPTPAGHLTPTCLTTVTHTTKYFINLWKILQSLLNYEFMVVDNL